MMGLTSIPGFVVNNNNRQVFSEYCTFLPANHHLMLFKFYMDSMYIIGQMLDVTTNFC